MLTAFSWNLSFINFNQLTWQYWDGFQETWSWTPYVKFQFQRWIRQVQRTRDFTDHFESHLVNAQHLTLWHGNSINPHCPYQLWLTFEFPEGPVLRMFSISLDKLRTNSRVVANLRQHNIWYQLHQTASMRIGASGHFDTFCWIKFDRLKHGTPNSHDYCRLVHILYWCVFR